VAHAVSVIVVQAGAERLRLGADAGPTGQALMAIEESGRTALAELRTMLGVLRGGSEESLVPLPGVAAVPALVERLRATGLPVELTCHDEALSTGGGVVGSASGLAAYRIIQEALTNVMRHAGLVPTRVELEVAEDQLRLLVTNGPPARGHVRGPSGGRGLSGMRERATALGGTFEAREREGGGYVVRAHLPLRAAAVPS
jgi:signal transduction histidine kinase